METLVRWVWQISKYRGIYKFVKGGISRKTHEIWGEIIYLFFKISKFKIYTGPLEKKRFFV